MRWSTNLCCGRSAIPPLHIALLGFFNSKNAFIVNLNKYNCLLCRLGVLLNKTANSYDKHVLKDTKAKENDGIMTASNILSLDLDQTHSVVRSALDSKRT